MTIAAEPSSSLLNQTPDVLLCTNETLAEGECFGMPVCGFCYDFGQSQKPPWEYEVYNLVGVYTQCAQILALVFDWELHFSCFLLFFLPSDAQPRHRKVVCPLLAR